MLPHFLLPLLLYTDTDDRCSLPLQNSRADLFSGCDPKYEHEVEYLADLAAKVTYFPMFSDSQIKKENVTISKDFPLEIKGSDRVTGLVLKSGKMLELDGIFCLRNAIAPSKLVSGLEIENGHIKVDRTSFTT